MSGNARRIHAANSPVENNDKYIDYVNRYYDMIQQEKLSNKKKVEEAIKRQNFDIDQIQATNASKIEKSSSTKPSSPPTEPNQPLYAHHASDMAEQQNFRNAPRGDNYYPTSPEHYCDNSSDKANMSMAPYKFSSPRQRIADERSYEIVPSQVPVEPHPMHYETYPSNYDYYAPPPPQRTSTCTCSCFRQPNMPMHAGVNQISRVGYDLPQLPPTRDYRNANSMQHWHDNSHFKYDKCGDNDFSHSHSHPYGHYAAPYYAANQQQFNPVEMVHSNVNSYNYFSPRPPLVAKHSPCVHNVSSPLIPKEIQRNPPQKPPSTSFMNSMRLEWEKNFNAARIERENNVLKNR